MGKTIGVIQARMGSDRLPGKILAPLAGRPLLAQLSARILPARIDEWWLATTSDPADDVTEAWAFELGLRVFRGHPSDVLSRFTTIAQEAKAEWVLRVTADNPFLDARVIDDLLEARDANEESKDAELLRPAGGVPITAGGPASSPTPATAGFEGPPTSPILPIGYGVELARREALERAAAEIPEDQPHHRTHVTSWLSGHASILEFPTPVDWPSRPEWRWTIDTYEDLAMARSAFRLFGLEAATIGYPQMVELLDEHPEIADMNSHIRQKALEEG